MSTATSRAVVVGGARTPFVKAGTHFTHRSALDLATHSVNGIIEKFGLEPDVIDELVYGIVTLDARVPQFAREVNFLSSLPASVRSYTVTDNCITGITAISNIVDSILLGRSQAGIAGGVESMSNPSILFSRRAGSTFSDLGFTRTTSERLKLLARLRPADFKPRTPGVTEPSTGLSMGEHTEITVKEWDISRVEQDEIAYRSHMRAAAATEAGLLTAEIRPLDDIAHDTIVRPETSMEKLAKLPPVFDRGTEGTLTAGNYELAQLRVFRSEGVFCSGFQ